MAVPYFFFAAGYFLAGKFSQLDKSLVEIWKVEVSERIGSLVIPFLIWMLIYYARNYSLWHLKTSVFHVSADPGAWTLPIGVQVVRFLGLHPFLDIGVFWFLRCLFALVVLSPLLLLASRYWRISLSILTALFVAFLWVCGQSFNWNFYFFFDRYVTIRGMLWFFVGMVARQGGWALVRGRAFGWGLTVFGFCLLFVKDVLDLHCLGSYMNLIEALSVPFLMFGVLSILPIKKLPQYLVGNAFAIFLMHNIFLSLVAMGLMVARLHDSPMLQVPIMILRLVMAVAISIIVAQYLRKFFPKAAAVVFGGR